MRSRHEYDNDVASLKSVRHSCHVRGVKRMCELNTVHDFHVTENFSLDIMHILLEGVVPVELGCIMFSLIAEKRLFTSIF
jgi:hypothetical protein